MTFAIGGMWGAAYLQHVHGMSKARAGGYQSMFGLALLLGAPAIAALANRVGRKPVAVGGTSLQLLCLAVLAAFPRQVPGPALYPLFFCLYLAGNTNGPLGAVIARELFAPASPAPPWGWSTSSLSSSAGSTRCSWARCWTAAGGSGRPTRPRATARSSCWAWPAPRWRWPPPCIRETLPSSRRPAGMRLGACRA